MDWNCIWCYMTLCGCRGKYVTVYCSVNVAVYDCIWLYEILNFFMWLYMTLRPSMSLYMITTTATTTFITVTTAATTTFMTPNT